MGERVAISDFTVFQKQMAVAFDGDYRAADAFLLWLNDMRRGVERLIDINNTGSATGGGSSEEDEVESALPERYIRIPNDGTLTIYRLVHYSGTTVRLADAELGFEATHVLFHATASYYYLSAYLEITELVLGSATSDGSGILHLFTDGKVTKDKADIVTDQGLIRDDWPDGIFQSVGRWLSRNPASVSSRISAKVEIHDEYGQNA